MSNGKQGGEKGGFVLGMVVGLLLGLAIALGVALYVAKVPIPFIDKVPQRTAAEDEADAQAHKNWNPNAKLPGGTVPSRAPAASGVVAAPPSAAQSPTATSATATPTAASAVPPPAAAAKPASAPASAAAGTHVFFVQAGAFTQASDAEQQRAKLAMQGLNAKVYERASGDRSVYRVRIGPFDDREAADALLAQVKAAGMEAVMVRTQR